MTAEDSLRRTEELLDRLEQARAELAQLAESESEDAPDRAIEVLSELAEIAKQVEAELARARRDAEAES